jgi:murein DD-endopeptidase MepM/ murein hydrolase activator NlpD
VRARRRRRGRLIPAIAFGFYAGLAAGWWIHEAVESPADISGAGTADERRAERRHAEPAPGRSGGTDVLDGPTAGLDASPGETPTIGPNPVAELRRRALRLPIDDADIAATEGHFAQPRGGGTRRHRAVDILAPHHTPVRAVEAGTIARLLVNEGGGITIYQFDPSKRYCYYYAHLDRYADGLREGARVARGEVIGYVGTTGNAPPDTPHLHFAIFELSESERWWDGRPVDPFLVLQE